MEAGVAIDCERQRRLALSRAMGPAQAVHWTSVHDQHELRVHTGPTRAKIQVWGQGKGSEPTAFKLKGLCSKDST